MLSRGDHAVAVFLALACALFVHAPHLLAHRAFVNLDFTVHYNYAREYAAALAAGDLWPRYAFLAQQGLGEPGLLYYSPLYYVLTAQVAQVTGNVWAAMQAVEMLCTVLLGYFCWRLAAQHVDRRRAWLAIPLASVAPMAGLLHLSFNGYPWASATAPIAALTWAVLRAEARGRLFNLPAILALAAIVLMHTVSGLMAVIMLGALAVPPLLRHRLKALGERDFWAPACIAVPGLLLSACYLLPAYGLQHLIDAAVWRQNYTPFNAFSLPSVTAWAFGVRWFAFQWPISLFALLLAGLSLAILTKCLKDPAGKRLVALSIAVTAVILFLATELSYPLWLIDSPLRNIQFPHRLITVLVPLGAVLAAIALGRGGGLWLRGALALAALASLAMGGLVVVKAGLRDGAVIDTAERRFLPYDGLDEYRTAQSIRHGDAAESFDFQRECETRGAVCSPGTRSGRGMAWRAESPVAAALRLPVYCFPGWSVTVNGKPAPARCDERAGLVETDIAPGASTVSLQWVMLPLEKAGLAISLLTALAIAGIAVLTRTRKGSALLSPP